ncbi:MAG: PTS fructose transporter subunit IIA [bacterium]|nr:PTS fructose transporter subunit IIA [bacterium]
MVGLVVVGHGELSEALLRTLESVVGKQQHVAAVTSAPEDGPETIRARIVEAVQQVDQGHGVLIVTDMLGDTQTNLSVSVARETGAQVVAGVNMPMLVKLSSARVQMEAPALAKFIRRYGQEHIFCVTAAS